MAGSRQRILDGRRTISGYIRQYNPPYTRVLDGKSGKYWSCADYVGFREKDNSFTLNKYVWRPPICEGSIKDVNGNVIKDVVNVAPYGIWSHWPNDPRTPFALPDFTSGIPVWVARMQPGKPKLNVPVVLGEAREIPSLVCQLPDLIRGWGKFRFGKNAGRAERAAKVARQAARDLGSTHLWYKFGISPSVSDALSMLGLLDSFLKALDDLMRLKRRGALKRSLRLPPGRAVQNDGNVMTHSNGMITYHNRVQVVLMRQWVTSRWVPLVPGYYRVQSQRELVKRAMRQVMGLNAAGLLTAWWELLPWSWLTDWFANVQRQLGMLGAGFTMMLRLESLCFCRTCTRDIYWYPTSIPAGVTCESDGYSGRVTKERVPLQGTVVDADAPSLPAFTGSQLGILAGLLAQRQ